MYLVGAVLWIAVVCGLLHLRLPTDDLPGRWLPSAPYYALWSIVVAGFVAFQFSAMNRAGHGRAALLLDAVAVAVYLSGHLGLRWVRRMVADQVTSTPAGG